MNNTSCDNCGAQLKSGVLVSFIDHIVKTIFNWRKLATCSMCKLELCGYCISDHKCIRV